MPLCFCGILTDLHKKTLLPANTIIPAGYYPWWGSKAWRSRRLKIRGAFHPGEGEWPLSNLHQFGASDQWSEMDGNSSANSTDVCASSGRASHRQHHRVYIWLPGDRPEELTAASRGFPHSPGLPPQRNRLQKESSNSLHSQSIKDTEPPKASMDGGQLPISAQALAR